MGARGKLIEAKINECNRQLMEVKNAMKTQKGPLYNNSRTKAMNILKRRQMFLLLGMRSNTIR